MKMRKNLKNNPTNLKSNLINSSYVITPTSFLGGHLGKKEVFGSVPPKKICGENRPVT